MGYAEVFRLIRLIGLSRRSQALTTEQRQGLLLASWVGHPLAGLPHHAAQVALVFVTILSLMVTIYAAGLVIGLGPTQAFNLLLAATAVLGGMALLFVLLCGPEIESRTLLAFRRISRPYYNVVHLVVDRPYRGRASGVYEALVNEALARGCNYCAVARPVNERLACRYRELGFVDIPNSGNPPLMVREPDALADALPVREPDTAPTLKE